MAKRRSSRPRRIPPPGRVPRAPRRRAPVTRAEYNALIAVLNTRNEILNALRQAVERLERASEVQFKRIAQLQADLDEIKREWDRMKVS